LHFSQFNKSLITVTK